MMLQTTLRKDSCLAYMNLNPNGQENKQTGAREIRLDLENMETNMIDKLKIQHEREEWKWKHKLDRHPNARYTSEQIDQKHSQSSERKIYNTRTIQEVQRTKYSECVSASSLARNCQRISLCLTKSTCPESKIRSRKWFSLTHTIRALHRQISRDCDARIITKKFQTMQTYQSIKYI